MADVNVDAERLKQLTWLAGRKSTPAPWQRSVFLTRHGAAATDGYSSGWYRDDHHDIPEGQMLAPDAADLRRQIGKGDVDLGELEPDSVGLLRWLVSTAAGARQGDRFRVPNGGAWIAALNKQAKAGARRLHVRSDLILVADTTRRALRQWKGRDAELELWYTDSLCYTQCPVTEVHLMWTKIDPAIDPGNG